MAVRHSRYSIVPRDPVSKIHFLGQTYPADELQVPPDRAIPNRPIRSTNLVIELVDRNMGTEFKERSKHQFTLGSHLEPFGLEELFHFKFCLLTNIGQMKTIFNFNKQKYRYLSRNNRDPY